MKNIIYIAILCLLSFFLTNCRTKQVTTHQQEQKTDVVERLLQQEETTQKTSVSSEELERQTQLMTELIAKINLAFSGKSKDDKLLFELKRTLDGLSLQVGGTGEATYQQDEKINFEEIEKRLNKRQDSVISTLNLKLSNLELKIDHYFKEKDKEVKVKGFSFGVWVYIIVGLILLAVAGFLKFRPKIF